MLLQVITMQYRVFQVCHIWLCYVMIFTAWFCSLVYSFSLKYALQCFIDRWHSQPVQLNSNYLRHARCYSPKIFHIVSDFIKNFVWKHFFKKYCLPIQNWRTCLLFNEYFIKTCSICSSDVNTYFVINFTVKTLTKQQAKSQNLLYIRWQNDIIIKTIKYFENFLLVLCWLELLHESKIRLFCMIKTVFFSLLIKPFP